MHLQYERRFTQSDPADHGHACDPSRVPEPDLSSPIENRKMRGLGLFFMRKLMEDSFDFSE